MFRVTPTTTAETVKLRLQIPTQVQTWLQEQAQASGRPVEEVAALALDYARTHSCVKRVRKPKAAPVEA